MKRDWDLADAAGKRRVESVLLKENENLLHKLVRKNLKRLSNGSETDHLELEDLEQSGYIGMLKAFSKWDPSISKYSTYCNFWILREMQLATKQAQDIHKPARTIKPKSINDFQNKERTKTGEETSLANINAFRQSQLKPTSTPRERKAAMITENHLDEWRRSNKLASLDETTSSVICGHIPGSGSSQGFGNSITLHDITPAEGQGPETKTQHAELAKILMDGLDTLKKREADVLFKMFYQNFTEQRVAEVMNISRTAVQNIKNRALEKLRTALELRFKEEE